MTPATVSGLAPLTFQVCAAYRATGAANVWAAAPLSVRPTPRRADQRQRAGAVDRHRWWRLKGSGY